MGKKTFFFIYENLFFLRYPPLFPPSLLWNTLFLPLVIFQCFIVGMISILARPEKKARWTPIRKISIWGMISLFILCIINTMVLGSMAVFASFDSPLVITIPLLFFLFGFLMTISIYSLFKKRVACDINYEEPEYTLDWQRILLLARICQGVSIVGLLCPFIGIVAFILAVIIFKHEELSFEPENNRTIKRMAWCGIFFGGIEIILTLLWFRDRFMY
jgi:heme A synthase